MKPFEPSTRISFDQLVLDYRRRLLTFARRLCGDVEDAEDLVQVTFAKAFLHYADYREKNSLDSWLKKILQNSYLDQRRRKGRRPVELGECSFTDGASMESFADPHRFEDEILGLDENQTRVMASVRRLDPGRRRLLEEAYFQERTVADIAAAHGMRPVTVRTKLFRIRERVRDRATVSRT